jgi:hypothetical protein
MVDIHDRWAQVIMDHPKICMAITAPFILEVKKQNIDISH